MQRFTLFFIVASIFTAVISQDQFFDHDIEFYPNAHSYELDFLEAQSHSEIPNDDPDFAFDEDSEDELAVDAHPSGVRNVWQRNFGDEVQGGYTLLEPDGTVTRITYTEKKPSGEHYDSLR